MLSVVTWRSALEHTIEGDNMSTPYRALYDALQQCDERNYAKDHSYESWLEWYFVEQSYAVPTCQREGDSLRARCNALEVENKELKAQIQDFHDYEHGI